jgi:hypothetical protein
VSVQSSSPVRSIQLTQAYRVSPRLDAWVDCRGDGALQGVEKRSNEGKWVASGVSQARWVRRQQLPHSQKVLLTSHDVVHFADEDTGVVDGLFQVGIGAGGGEKALAITLHGMGGGEQNGQ